MTAGDWMNLVGRLLVAFYFLWSAAFNIRAWNFNLSEFERVGLPSGVALLIFGLVLQTLGSLLFLYSATVIQGAALLILFTVTADVLFHRYWTYPDQKDRTMHQQFLFEHMALVGGILGLAATHL